MSTKGVKNVRGQPEKYEELKTSRNLSLTNTAVAGLDAIVEALGLESRSDLIEQIGRGLIPVGGEGVQDIEAVKDALLHAYCFGRDELTGKGMFRRKPKGPRLDYLNNRVPRWKKELDLLER